MLQCVVACYHGYSVFDLPSPHAPPCSSIHILETLKVDITWLSYKYTVAPVFQQAPVQPEKYGLKACKVLVMKCSLQQFSPGFLVLFWIPGVLFWIPGVCVKDSCLCKKHLPKFSLSTSKYHQMVCQCRFPSCTACAVVTTRLRIHYMH